MLLLSLDNQQELQEGGGNMTERNYSIEHANRQRQKHRIGIEVDREKWDALTAEQKMGISKELRKTMVELLEKNIWHDRIHQLLR